MQRYCDRRRRKATFGVQAQQSRDKFERDMTGGL
jgi:hypothetical protein